MLSFVENGNTQRKYGCKLRIKLEHSFPGFLVECSQFGRIDANLDIDIGFWHILGKLF